MPGKLSDPPVSPVRTETRKKPSREEIMHIEELDSLARFSASLIHEINNPLTGILIYSQLLRRKIEGGDFSREKTLGYLDKMENELSMVMALLRSLTDFAQQSPLQLAAEDPLDIITDALEGFSSVLAARKIELVRELNRPLPTLMADRPRLRQVLVELLENAVRAMPEGGRLTVRAMTKDRSVTIDVEDTGCGISASNLSRLFIPFFSTRPEVKRVGLGLCSAYGIIEKHGGSIEVRSREGQGSLFSLRLPVFTA
jgi:two-component system, NtrC family, sensor kinase